jgi:hypothetical protein
MRGLSVLSFFRGSISGLGFAYCDFTRYQGRADVDQPAAWAIVGDCRQIISATEASRPFRPYCCRLTRCLRLRVKGDIEQTCRHIQSRQERYTLVSARNKRLRQIQSQPRLGRKGPHHNGNSSSKNAVEGNSFPLGETKNTPNNYSSTSLLIHERASNNTIVRLVFGRFIFRYAGA